MGMGELENGLPRSPLDRALSVASAIRDAGQPLTRDQVALEMGIKPGTGSANTRTIAARKFGLIRRHPRGGYAVTDLGLGLLSNPDDEVLRERSILGVEAFRRLRDCLERDPNEYTKGHFAGVFREFGISEPRAREAAAIFARSWAGGFAASLMTSSQAEPPTRRIEREAAVEGNPFEHPLMIQVMAQIPPPARPWDAASRDAWLELFASTVRFLYPGQDGPPSSS